MKNQVSNGASINVTATGNFTGGNIHLGVDRAGIYAYSGTTGAVAVVALTGEFQVTKSAGTGEGIGILDKVFAKATGGSVVASATGTVPLGHSSAAAATGATSVKVILAPH